MRTVSRLRLLPRCFALCFSRVPSSLELLSHISFCPQNLFSLCPPPSPTDLTPTLLHQIYACGHHRLIRPHTVHSLRHVHDAFQSCLDSAQQSTARSSKDQSRPRCQEQAQARHHPNRLEPAHYHSWFGGRPCDCFARIRSTGSGGWYAPSRVSPILITVKLTAMQAPWLQYSSPSSAHLSISA